MRKIAIVLFLVFIAAFAWGKDIRDLNGFKYAIVETLFYEDDQVDIYGISAFVRKQFIELGIKVVANNPESWPNELKANPCLALRCDIKESRRFLGRQKVELFFKDCNGEIFYSTAGYGNADTFIESFKYAVNDAFDEIREMGYDFNPDKRVTREISRENESEATAKAYLDNNELKLLEGIYESKTGTYNKIFIKNQSSGEYKAIMLASDNINWSPGELKGRLNKSTIPNLYNVIWHDHNKNELTTIAVVDAEGKISLELRNNQNKKFKVDYVKIYPEA